MTDRHTLSHEAAHLISPEALYERMEEGRSPVLLDCRFNLKDPAEGETLYRRSHLPRALYAHLDKDLSAPVVPGKTGRHPLPKGDVLQATLRHWGLNNDSEVVVYDANNAMFAARAWWLCRWAGIREVRVLDGGWDAWHEAGLPTESGSGHRPKQGTLVAECPEDWVVTTEELAASLSDYLLLDARAEPRYTGETEPMDSEAGHIPGALCADFTANVDSRGRFFSSERLAHRYEAVPDSSETLCYCGSGVTACHTILALTLAGHRQPRLYAGSWSEWIQDERHPIETGLTKEPL